MSVYLVDVVTGGVVFHTSHKAAVAPVHLVHSENWIVVRERKGRGEEGDGRGRRRRREMGEGEREGGRRREREGGKSKEKRERLMLHFFLQYQFLNSKLRRHELVILELYERDSNQSR